VTLQKPEMIDIPLALVRVLSMMTGELDYENLFSFENTGVKSNIHDTSASHNDSKIVGESDEKEVRHNFHPAAAHVWYVCMIIMVTLVLMNLLVGLAVSDIQVRHIRFSVILTYKLLHKLKSTTEFFSIWNFQRCRKDAEAVVMKRRIRYTAYLEKSYYLLTHFLPGFIKDFLRRRIAIIKPDVDGDSCFKSQLLRVDK